jgi:hypothetical protein
MFSVRKTFPNFYSTLITSFLLHENENGGNVGNSALNGNPETLTALAAQLVDLLKMGANAN